MLRSENNIDRIHLYLKGLLDESSMRDIEEKLKSDPAFEAEFEKQKIAFDAIETLIATDLKNSLKTLPSPEQEKNPPTFNLRSIVKYAASLVILISSIWVYSHFNKQSNAFFAEMYIESPMIQGEKRAASAEDDVLASINEAYYDKDANVLMIIRDQIPDVQTKQYIDYLDVWISFENEAYQEANSSILEILSNQHNIYAEGLEYLNIICLLKLDKPNEEINSAIDNYLQKYDSRAADRLIQLKKKINHPIRNLVQ